METTNSLARLAAKKSDSLMAAAADVAHVAFQPAERPFFNLRTSDRPVGDPVVKCKAAIGGRDAAATQVRIPHALRERIEKYARGPATVVLVALADAMLDQLLAEGKTLHVENEK
ncbi:hypothetical protein C7401_102281 [Paraburkholderia unamae]|uniref:hypothetical protein n=1 Tax=Paraburkholderia unamae TaxID=219649 RepID=UPI000DC2685F|nr:hypothetical protein [Paraburkholderia unamae]RAR66856.1 hypothetical protein C7401_102281 [Paraburkholderia unamae]